VTVVRVLPLLAIINPMSAGILQLVKGSWDTLGLDYNKVLGPISISYRFMSQIHLVHPQQMSLGS
jgi:hypothetical protein